MNGWLIGLILIVGYLAIQNMANVFRFKQLVKAISSLSDILAEVSELPQEKANEVREMWGEAKTKGEVKVAVGSLVLLVILVFLVALAIHGKL